MDEYSRLALHVVGDLLMGLLLLATSIVWLPIAGLFAQAGQPAMLIALRAWEEDAKDRQRRLIRFLDDDPPDTDE